MQIHVISYAPVTGSDESNGHVKGRSSMGSQHYETDDTYSFSSLASFHGMCQSCSCMGRFNAPSRPKTRRGELTDLQVFKIVSNRVRPHRRGHLEVIVLSGCGV